MSSRSSGKSRKAQCSLLYGMRSATFGPVALRRTRMSDSASGGGYDKDTLPSRKVDWVNRKAPATPD